MLISGYILSQQLIVINEPQFVIKFDMYKMDLPYLKELSASQHSVLYVTQ